MNQWVEEMQALLMGCDAKSDERVDFYNVAERCVV